jgi:hypothetical protein
MTCRRFPASGRFIAVAGGVLLSCLAAAPVSAQVGVFFGFGPGFYYGPPAPYAYYPPPAFYYYAPPPPPYYYGPPVAPALPYVPPVAAPPPVASAPYAPPLGQGYGTAGGYPVPQQNQAALAGAFCRAGSQTCAAVSGARLGDPCACATARGAVWGRVQN